MPKKKIEVVELNKKEEQIILEEAPSALILFWRRNRWLILSLLMMFSLLIFGVSVFMFIKNLNKSVEPIIKEASINISLSDYETNVASNKAMTDETAQNAFANTNLIESKGETLLVKTVETDRYTIKYFSDGVALRIDKNNNNSITKINPLSNGKYGISDDGVINSKANTSTLTITNTKNYPWGTVNYYNDNSAEIVNSKMNMYVRDSKDIHDNYISNNKLSYLKETKNVGNNVINYYYDGTIEVIKNNQSYIVRSSDDLDITGNDVTFKNNNEAKVISTKKTNNGLTIDYYEDGGAIIRDGDKTLSVRKSNSIKLKDNDIYEIVDSIYVTESKKTDTVTYYTNGGAVVNYDNKPVYVPENSDIKYDNNDKVKSVGANAEKLVKETKIENENVKSFEKNAVVKTDKYTAILPKNDVLYDPLGRVKDLDKPVDGSDAKRSFTITNNTNETIHYRVVIEQSDKTSINPQYLRYQMTVKEKYISPTSLNSKVWTTDKVSKALNIKGKNYILVESTIEALDSDEVTLMMWADYDTIPNSEMNKYFYGTIRVYAWTEEDNNKE